MAKKKLNKRTKIRIVIIFLILLSIDIHIGVSIYRRIVFLKPYDKAWELLMEGNYSGVDKYIEECNKINSEYQINTFYQSSAFVRDLNYALKSIEKERYENAYRFLGGWCYKDQYRQSRSYSMVIMSKEQKKFAEEKINMIYDAYEEHLPEIEESHRRSREYIEKTNKENENKAKSCDVPYRGMYDDYIGMTKLGFYSDHEIEQMDEYGKNTDVDVYTWKSKSTQRVIFKVYCVAGVVREVEDSRTEADKQSSGTSGSKGTSGTSSSSSRTKKTESATVDPLDHDIEQYYEDYKDEFEDEDDAWDDFEDNEEYWDDY